MCCQKASLIFLDFPKVRLPTNGSWIGQHFPRTYCVPRAAAEAAGKVPHPPQAHLVRAQKSGRDAQGLAGKRGTILPRTPFTLESAQDFFLYVWAFIHMNYFLGAPLSLLPTHPIFHMPSFKKQMVFWPGCALSQVAFA